jgi:molybdate transport system substrate-binding protein
VKNKMQRLAAAASIGIIALAAFTFFLSRTTRAEGDEVRILVSDGMKPVVEELTPQIEKAIGHKLAPTFNSSRNLRDKIGSGQAFDAVVITDEVLDDLIKQGKVTSTSRADIAHTGISVGVRHGAPKPDVTSADAIKRAILNAKTISFNPTGASAPHIYAMFEKLGISDAVKPKLMLDSEAGRPQKNVAEGKADLVFSLVPEVEFFPGVDLVAPIPSEFQSFVKFAAGAAPTARDSKAAQAFIQFLASPMAVPVIKSKGMEPK